MAVISQISILTDGRYTTMPDGAYPPTVGKALLKPSRSSRLAQAFTKWTILSAVQSSARSIDFLGST